MFSEAVMHNRIDWVTGPPLVDSMSSAARLHMTAPVEGFAMPYNGYYSGSRDLLTHKELAHRMAESLKADGEQFPNYPELMCGQPDIVTDTHIYEVKRELTLSALQRGIGQLLMYAQDLPGRVLVLIGYEHNGVARRPYVERLGIELEVLPDDAFQDSPKD